MKIEELLRRIVGAVKRGIEARSAFYTSLDIKDEQKLGAPAPGELIKGLEIKLGRSLPQSYKAFLGLHNGWHMVDAETDLLSVEELLAGPLAAKIKAWQDQAAEWGDTVASNGFVIGYSNISQSRIILDPAAVSADGEWQLLEHYKDEVVAYDSFLHWLEQSVEDYVEIGDQAQDEEDNS